MPMFDGNSSSSSGDIKYLNLKLLIKTTWFEGSSNFMSGSYSWYVTNLPDLVAIDIAVVQV